jgi:hypothetical protein
VELGIKATAVCSEKLQQLLKDIDKVWNNLIGFMSLATLTVSPLNNSSVTPLSRNLSCKAKTIFVFFLKHCLEIFSVYFCLLMSSVW